MIRIELPWPSKSLSPNARVHWAEMARAKRKARHAAWGFTKAVMSAAGIKAGAMRTPLSVRLTFHPEIDRARDLDNMQARMKAGLDGIASALGIDDVHFRPASEMGRKMKPARVVIEISEAEQ